MPRTPAKEEVERSREYSNRYHEQKRPKKPRETEHWRCINVNPLDPFRPGYDYLATMVQGDIRAGWLHRGTAFKKPDGEEIRL